MCLARLRHKDNIARCRLFVVPGDGPALLAMPALLGMPDNELVVILKITHEVVRDQQHTGKLTPKQ